MDILAITPEAQRRFVAEQSELHRTSGGETKLISVLRGYLRFRTACGDQVR